MEGILKIDILMEELRYDRRENFSALIFNAIPGLVFVLIMWLVKFIEHESGQSFASYGNFPRRLENLYGILTSPFLHGDWEHLWSNTLPMLVLMTLLVHFYQKIWPAVLLWLWLLSESWLWIAGRPSFHIGASTIIYALALFLIVSGFVRKNRSLIAISLVVVFLYGSLFWGLFPLKPQVSFEAHIFGAVAGLMVAYAYRRTGPQKVVRQWSEEEPDFDWGEGRTPEEFFDPEPPQQRAPRVYRFRYFFSASKEGSG